MEEITVGWDCVENRTEASLLLEQVQQNRLGEDSEMNLQTKNTCVNNRLLSLKDSRKAYPSEVILSQNCMFILHGEVCTVVGNPSYTHLRSTVRHRFVSISKRTCSCKFVCRVITFK